MGCPLYDDHWLVLGIKGDGWPAIILLMVGYLTIESLEEFMFKTCRDGIMNINCKVQKFHLIMKNVLSFNTVQWLNISPHKI